MSNVYQRAWAIAGAVFALLSVPLLSHAQFPDKDAAKQAKVTPDLLQAQRNNGATSAPAASQDGLRRVMPYRLKDGRIAIEAVAAEGQDGNALLQQLKALGLTDGIAYEQLIFGYLPLDKIDDLKDVTNLKFAQPSYKPNRNAGKVTSQGDKAMRSDIARQTYSVDGAGVKVGVISDSYNALGGAPAGVASGDLPANVQVIDDYLSDDAIDEGRAMAEIVHDVAPGAAIAFNTAYRGQAGFAKGIRDLAAAGCNIITDDVGYFAEPFFQDGIVSQAIRDVVTNKGVTYFTSAGNSERASYESTARVATTAIGDPFVGFLGYPHNFNPSGTDYLQRVIIPARGLVNLLFQWDDRFYSVNGAPGARTDMDLLIYYNGVLRLDLAFPEDNLGGDPIEFTQIENLNNAPIAIDIVLVKSQGPNPTRVKWINVNASLLTSIEYDTRSSSIFGHSNEKSAISVGAARYDRTPAFNPTLTTARIEGFSTTGGTPILFDLAGDRLSMPIIRQKPEITAADGGNTTFFGFDYEGDGFPNFFGTSASAPHAAGVAALMKEKSGNTLSYSNILSVMEQTALDMDDPFTAGFDTGFDFTTGYGFIQADKALQQIAGPTAFAITGVTTVNCQTLTAGLRRVTFTPQYSGLNGQAVTFSVVNETSPTTSPGPFTLDLYTDNPVITLKAMQMGTSGEATFSYNWLTACGSNPTPNPTPNPGTLTITGVTGVSCTAVTAGLRRVSLSPQYSGLNGQAVTFQVVNEFMPTTAPGPYVLNLYTDNPVITLKATQAGTPGEATFAYNWLAACGAGSARLPASADAGLQVRMLGNPVADELTVEIAGAADGPLTLKLTDMQGRVIENRQVDQGRTTGRHSFNVSRQTPGLLLLHTTVGQQRQVSKVLKK